VSKRTWRPPYSTRATYYVYIPMRDGIRLASNVFVPDCDGPFPCLMVRTPYNKNGFDLKRAQPWVRQGYALVVVDSRGTGGSEGDHIYFGLPDHTTDGADVVNWIADQPFCDGNVGTFGGSALGFSQVLTAEQAPPALKAVYLEVAPVNLYHDNWFPGGVFHTGARMGWIESMVNNTCPGAAVQKVDGEVDEQGAVIREQVALDRVRLREQRLLDGKTASPQEWMIPMRQTTEYTEFWESRNRDTAMSRCDIPATYRGIWFDHFVYGSCRAYGLHRGPKRLIVNPGSQGTHGSHADMDSFADQLRWFDHWLKGIDTGIMDEEPVRLFVMGEERWRTFETWPPPGEASTLALSRGSALAKPDQAEAFEDTFEHDPDRPLASIKDVQDIREYEQGALTYTSAPLTEDCTVIGCPMVKLRLRSTGADAHVMVKLADVFPDGRSRQVAYGRLRAALREGFDKVVPVPAGETVELTIPLWPTANTFLAGHRIRLVVAGSDAPYAHVCPVASRCEIVSAAGAESVLELPVVV
jgi:uncharacterized protein